eukprot:670335-Amphidinium_carterae.1
MGQISEGDDARITLQRFEHRLLYKTFLIQSHSRQQHHHCNSFIASNKAFTYVIPLKLFGVTVLEAIFVELLLSM